MIALLLSPCRSIAMSNLRLRRIFRTSAKRINDEEFMRLDFISSGSRITSFRNGFPSTMGYEFCSTTQLSSSCGKALPSAALTGSAWTTSPMALSFTMRTRFIERISGGLSGMLLRHLR